MINFNQYSIEQLRQLNEQLVEHIRVRIQRESQREMESFELGQRVSFENKYGEIIEGRLIRFNQKTVTIETPEGDWRVAPQLLRKVIYTQKSEKNVASSFQLPKVSRNSPCPCGSGRKFKRCCAT